MNINSKLKVEDLSAILKRVWELSESKLDAIQISRRSNDSVPVVTVDGRYQGQEWTNWTQGFQFGSAILHFDATDDRSFLDTSLEQVRRHMPLHLTHFGVHDHGFNIQSTYGNLLRLYREGRISQDKWLEEYLSVCLKTSASVQARRWTSLSKGGYIYSFNGPHSLFVDTLRTIRILEIGHMLGHKVKGENDTSFNLLTRAIQHGITTARYSVYYGKGRDTYDERGRTAHESVFNLNDGCYRTPSTQQGFSGYSTWTRGLAWAILGFAEQLEFLDALTDESEELSALGGREKVKEIFKEAAMATCDYYLTHTPIDGIPYWDTHAPGLSLLGNWREKRADPFNDYEPVDSSAAVISAQGLLRMGKFLEPIDNKAARRYWQAGLTVTNSILQEPYLSIDENHQGLVLHSIYHRPRGWDRIPAGSNIPHSESSMWGDYHARELALYLQRVLNDGEYLTFFSGIQTRHGQG